MAEYVDSATVYINIRGDGFESKFPSPGFPANDNFANRTVISTTMPATLTGQTNKDAYWEVGEHNLSGSPAIGDQSVWYEFTPASSGYYKILFDNPTMQGDTTTGIVVVIMLKNAAMADFAEGVLGEVTYWDKLSLEYHVQVFGASGTVGADATFYRYLESGNTYVIKVYSNPFLFSDRTDNNAKVLSWTLTFDASALTHPANDMLADAEVISTSLPQTKSGSTFNATGEGGIYDSGVGQGVWYSFTPATTAPYKFTFPVADLVQHGSGVGSTYYIQARLWNGTGVTDINDITTAAYLGGTDIDDDSVSDGVMVESLTAGTTYLLDVFSGHSTDFNYYTADFEFVVEQLPPVDNDDFADAEPISGASGSIDFPTTGSSYEVTEPDAYYWNTGSNARSVWFDWTCPATGIYLFKVETTDTDARADYDLAVWQGTALNALTKVVRNWSGSEDIDGDYYSAATAVAFQAVNGQSYKIQVQCWNSVLSSESTLSWQTHTVVGNTTATATSFPNGRINNYGNDDTELPPNYASVLSGHSEWWFDVGQAGGVRWFKKVISQNETIAISGRQFDGFVFTSTVKPVNDMGLIVYKGANYGSLVVADQSGGTNDAAMMLTNRDFLPSPLNKTVSSTLTDITETTDEMQVDCVVGETVWIAIFGLYDVDPGWSDATAEDTPQFEIDLHVSGAPPVNDDWDETYDLPIGYPYSLGHGPYGSFGSQSHAVARRGSTLNATSEAGEPSRAGFPATRSVWYYWFPDYEDIADWTLTVESSVDCVVGIHDTLWPSGALGALLMSDDDSGAGTNPQITFNLWNMSNGGYFDTGWSGNDLAFVVDSKTEGDFVLKLSRATTGTPPANDDFADAVEITTVPFSQAGTTVDATVEFFEPNAVELDDGPLDTVWYKFVAPAAGMYEVYCDDISQLYDWYVYVDMFKGTTLENLQRYPSNPPWWPKGVFYADAIEDPGENRRNALIVNAAAGETFYIRVQTESGGSEDFTIHIDGAPIYVDIQALGGEEMHGTLLDDAEVYVRILPSAEFSTKIDAAEVFVNLQTSGTELQADEYADSATIYINLQFMGGECFSAHTGLMMDAEADPRWIAGADCRWFVIDAIQRWEVVDVQSEGVHC